jgi:phage FluMu gp28-like protein
LWRAIGSPEKREEPNRLALELKNGSRILALPGKEQNLRGFSGVQLLVLDEAARIPDELYYATRPMISVSGGKIAALSTPNGKRGWFHDEWHGSADWKRVRVEATDCPRISRQFLEEERRALGERWFNQEYLCEFSDTIGSVFAHADIHAAISDDTRPLF